MLQIIENIIKKQHFIPRFYLRKFSLIGDINDYNNDKKNKVLIYDKKNNKQYASTVYNIACENYFYDLDNVNNKNNKQIFENEFSNMESKFSMLLTHFINRCKQKENYYSALIINKKEREEFSFYLTMQLLRTKKFRDIQGKLYQKLLDNRIHFYKLYKKNYFNEEIALNVGDIKINSKTKQLKSLSDDELIDEFIYFISNSYWTFMYNDTSTPFIISDNPVCRIPIIYEGVLGLELSPFMSNMFQLCFPLSPKIMLYIYRDNSIFYKKFKRSIMNRLIPINKVELIDNINKFQCIMSNERVFFNPKDKNIIKKYCNESMTKKTNLFF